MKTVHRGDRLATIMDLNPIARQYDIVTLNAYNLFILCTIIISVTYLYQTATRIIGLVTLTTCPDEPTFLRVISVGQKLLVKRII